MDDINKTLEEKIKRYQEAQKDLQERREEASRRIEKIVQIDDFEFSIDYLKAIHKVIFRGLLENSGEFRDVNLTKQEKVLNGKSVIYPDYKDIERYIKHDIKEEKNRDYSKLTEEQKVIRVARFASNIWQVHPFREGNTRTTSVFIEKYLIHLGYNVDNHIFKENSRYFRNALVKSTYYSSFLSIRPDYEPLYNFFRKVMIDETIELNEEDVYVDSLFSKEENEKIRKRIKTPEQN